MKLSLCFISLCAGAFACAQVNVAASANGGVASQSSTYTSFGTGPADRAIDGNRNGNYYAGSVQHTEYELNAWWEVTFASASDIDVINIWNRTDGSQTRLNPFSIFLYDSLDNVVWSSLGNIHDDNIEDGDPGTAGMAFLVGGVTADRLRVQLDQTNYLHMAEVEAFTVVPEPMTMTLLGLGALAALRRKKQA